MIKLSIGTTTALLLTALAASPASAQTYDYACFDWTCTASTTTCQFDASACSGAPGDTPLDYRWTWGDGTPMESIWDNPLASHTYPNNQQKSFVTLSVGYLFIGYYDVTCEIIIYSPIGPVQETFSGTCT